MVLWSGKISIVYVSEGKKLRSIKMANKYISIYTCYPITILKHIKCVSLLTERKVRIKNKDVSSK